MDEIGDFCNENLGFFDGNCVFFEYEVKFSEFFLFISDVLVD